MAICHFYQQGKCKFGERCKYEHPGRVTTGSANRFGALAGGGPGYPAQKQDNYGVSVAEIKLDLTPGEGCPLWIFSAYGPGKNAPRQLFGGPQREQSFEEMRLRHYEATAAGNAGQAIQEAQALYAQSSSQMDAARNNLDAAAKYIVDGEKEHPNRIDIVEGGTGPRDFGQGPSAFGRPSAPFSQPSQPSAFGKPSTLGGGKPAFGLPSFGQPSAPGFGQPSSFGQGSSFGKPSGLGGQPAFGKPAFGQPSFGQPSFGQSSSLGTSALGKPSTASPFSQLGAQSQNQTGGFGGFGQASGPSPFSQQVGFGQPSTTATGGFGQPTQQAQNPFGQPSQQQPQQAPNPFGQPSGPAPNPFGAPAQQPTSFGQSAPPTATLGFGQPQRQQQQQQTMPVTTPQTGPPPFIKIDDPNTLNPIPSSTGQTIKDPMTKKLSAWKGQPVKYINDEPCYLHPQDGKTFVHIFFPNGPPDDASLRDSQGKPEEYTSEITEQYEFFLKNGYFKDGVVPSVPPKKQWLSFDF